MTTKEITEVVGLIGIGGLLKSIIDFFINNRKLRADTRHQFKEIRYKAILVLLYALMYYDKEQDQLKKHRPDIKTKDDLINEIRAEWTNMILFASDKVITTTQNFILEPNMANFNKTLLAMRKSLYGLRTKLKFRDLKI
jgi:hypothetical protein